MHSHEFIIQDAAAGHVSTVLNAMRQVASTTAFDNSRVSVAFASWKGCQNLHKHLADSARSWISARKRWLVSIDFGQTSPDALTFLAQLRNSKVRISDGVALLNSALVPKRAFHPKTFVLTGNEKSLAPELAIVSGSANLTYGALNTNAEHVFVSRRWGEPDAHDQPVLDALSRFRRWWELAWSTATPYSDDFIGQYEAIYKPAKQLQDAEELSGSFGRPGDTVVELDEGARWAASKFFWIEVGKLYKNRGPKRAGNQLDCRRGTRVFFGFPPNAVATNTVLGHIAIAYTGKPAQLRSVKFGDNAMDKVNLPVPGESGPESYDDSVLHFERTARDRYALSKHPVSTAEKWASKSKRQGLSYSLAGGRRFGFYS